MMAFESAGKRIGSLNVNLIRVALGALFLSVFCPSGVSELRRMYLATYYTNNGVRVDLNIWLS